MKVIISHDVDHVSVIEHKKDLIIPKFWIRSLKVKQNSIVKARLFSIVVKQKN
jgi:hypothetical protein